MENRVFHDTRVSWKNFENFLWNLSSIKNSTENWKIIFSKNSNFKIVIAKYFTSRGKSVPIFSISSIWPYWPSHLFYQTYPLLPIGVGKWFFNFCHVAIDFLQIVLELHSIVQMPSNHSQFLMHQLLRSALGRKGHLIANIECKMRIFFSYPNANPYIARMQSASERISMMVF